MSITKKCRVLIVDDSKTWREKIALLLSGIEHIGEVLLAGDYEEALPLLNLNPDFVFLDIYMPGKNGVQLLTFIKKNYPQPKVCMVSNSINMFTKQRWESLGVCECWDKSKDFDKIPEFIINNANK